MSRTLPLFQVDAFSDALFGGNPAAVVPLDRWLSDDLLQKIAAENNLAETAFYVRSGEGYDLRWFTPALEIDLCGHATLAAAHVLYEHQGYDKDHVQFKSKSGELVVSKKGNQLELNFPARPPQEIEAPQELLDGLGGAVPDRVLKSRDYVVVFNDEATIRNIQPNHLELSKLECIGIAVTAPGDDVDFASRFFAPSAG
jgi:PhzF family phenazine biosynthesis protein